MKAVDVEMCQVTWREVYIFDENYLAKKTESNAAQLLLHATQSSWQLNLAGEIVSQQFNLLMIVLLGLWRCCRNHHLALQRIHIVLVTMQNRLVKKL